MTPFLIVSGDFVRTGGMDMANFALASYLLRQGAEVHLVAHRVAPELVRMPGLKIHAVRKPLDSYTLGEPFLAAAGKKVARQLGSRGVRTIVNGGNCAWGDVNWVHYVHAAFVPPPAGSMCRRVLRAGVRRKSVRDERRALERAHVVIANSARTRSDILEHLRVNEERIRVVYYGCDPEMLQPVSRAERSQLRAVLGWDPARPVAVFIGALGDRRKGFDLLWAAFEHLLVDPGWDMDLAVLGHGHELEHWRDRSTEGGLGNRIRFLGFRDDVPRILAGCDLLVHPARYEAYGLGVHEALCRGIPAMVSAKAGVAERYPHELRQLLLEDAESVSELVEKLRYVRGTLTPLRQAMLPFARTLRERTWDTMASEIVELLRAE